MWTMAGHVIENVIRLGTSLVMTRLLMPGLVSRRPWDIPAQGGDGAHTKGRACKEVCAQLSLVHEQSSNMGILPQATVKIAPT
jgi:hypothetical protein